MFIVNPGDGLDVETFDNHARAAERCFHWKERGKPFVAMYSLFDGVFREVAGGNWYEVARDQLPLKVIALDRAPRPMASPSSSDPPAHDAKEKR